MKSICNISSLYIFLWVLYNLQGMLFGQGGAISQSILLGLLMLSLYYCCYVNMKMRPLPLLLKAMNFFLLFLSVYGVINLFRLEPMYLSEGAIVPVANHDYLKNLLISMTPTYAFYYFTKKGYINHRTLFWLLPIYLVVATMMYWEYNRNMLVTLASLGSTRTELTNNIGYVFVALIPLLFLWHKKMVCQHVFMSYILYYVVMSMKRGAILTAVLLVAWLVSSSFSLLSTKQRVRFVSFVAVIVILGISFVGNLMLESDYFNYRVEQTMAGNSSNREDFYGTLWRHWLEDSTFVEFFVGAGATETVNIVGNFAHNDWLELLINQGLLGVLLYVVYWIAFFRNWKLLRHDKELYAMMGCALLSCLIPSLFSMSYANMNMITTLVIGFCLANVRKMPQKI